MSSCCSVWLKTTRRGPPSLSCSTTTGWPALLPKSVLSSASHTALLPCPLFCISTCQNFGCVPKSVKQFEYLNQSHIDQSINEPINNNVHSLHTCSSNVAASHCFLRRGGGCGRGAHKGAHPLCMMLEFMYSIVTCGHDDMATQP